MNDARLTLRETEQNIQPPLPPDDTIIRPTVRAHLGVYCISCGAMPGEWCQPMNPSTASTASQPRRLHRARFVRLTALDAQGW